MRVFGRGRLFGALAAGVALAACRHEESRPAPPAPAEPALPAVTAAAPSFHEETFDLVLRAIGPYAAGKAGAAEIGVVAKGGYHCNEKYPYKFKPKDSTGVHFSAPVFERDAVRLEPASATMQIGFTPDSRGDKNLAGVFSFSLCSADRCLVEKRDLSLSIAVD
jgi:hypothetical protein